MTTTTAKQIGERIGRAMARDVLAEHMPRRWTGLDPQDGDELTAAGFQPGSAAWDAAEAAAQTAYDEALVSDTIELDLWVDNQVVDSDETEAYIAGADWQPPEGVELCGQRLSGEAEAVFAAFLTLAEAVAQAGHGDGDPGLSPPHLTACPVRLLAEGYTSAEESLARIRSRECGTFAEWTECH